MITGGLSRLRALCQRLANLCGVPVFRPEVTEATARGIAWLCSGRESSWPDAGPGREFSPLTDAGLEARYVIWQVAMAEAIERLAV